MLRFVRGIIDSEDVSREILQQSKALTNIKTASVKKNLHGRGRSYHLALGNLDWLLYHVGDWVGTGRQLRGFVNSFVAVEAIYSNIECD